MTWALADVPDALVDLVKEYELVAETFGAPVAADGSSESTIQRGLWGHYAVFVAGVDVSYLRDRLVQIDEIVNAEPHGYISASVTFPQVFITEPTTLDTNGNPVFTATDLAEIKSWANIFVIRVKPDGSLDLDIGPAFAGKLVRRKWNKASLAYDCIGALLVADNYVRAPWGLTPTAVDIATLIQHEFKTEFRGFLATIMQDMPDDTTGVTSTDYGNWDQGTLNYVERLLGKAVNSDGTQWTTHAHYDSVAENIVPVMHVKDLTTTTNFEIWAGADGIQEDVTDDVTLKTNAWYATMTDEAGTEYNFGVPSADGSVISYVPLSADPVVNPLSIDADGNIAEDDGPPFDSTQPRVEGIAQFGTGVSPDEAKRVLDRERARLAGEDFLGTFTLTADPIDHATGLPFGRRSIREGMNFICHGFEGRDVRFHVAQVDGSDLMNKASIQLTVDQKGRDASYIQALIDHKADALKSPVVSLLQGKSSAITSDQAKPWDAGAGSGWCPRSRAFNGTSTVAVPQGKWTIQRILAGEEETIIRTQAHAATDHKYCIAIFDRPLTATDITAEYQVIANPAATGFGGGTLDIPSDPFVAPLTDGTTPWDLSAALGKLVVFGQHGQGAGFYPGYESRGNSPTGDFEFDNQWTITHTNVPLGQVQPMYVWVAFFSPDAAIDIWLQLSHQAKALR